MFKKFRYTQKMKYRNFLHKKEQNNDKNYIIRNEIYILEKLNESIMFTPGYHNDLYKSFEREFEESSDSNLIESCCIYADIKDILYNLNIRDIKLLYLYLENIDYIAKTEYNISDIFSIVNEENTEIKVKDIGNNGNINKYSLRVNIVKFNLLYNKMKNNWYDFIGKRPIILIALCIFVPQILDIIKDVIIAWKFDT